MKRSADWLGWSLYFVLGLIVGAVIGFVIASRRARRLWNPLLDAEHAHLFVLGAALLGGAICSHFGDRLWLGSRHSVIAPDEPQQNHCSRAASLLAGLVGTSLALLAVARSW